MTRIENFLRFDASANRLTGQSPLENTLLPTASGLNWLAVPRTCTGTTIGLAYRCNGNSIEALRISGDDEPEILHSVGVPFFIVNLAASFDGRLLAVCLSDGSLCCYDATNKALTLRWSIPNAHSHVVTSIQESVSASRANAAGAAGPARSLQFSPTGYVLALVDSGRQILSIFHADHENPVNIVRNQLLNLQASAAAWDPVWDGQVCVLAVGTSNGNGIVKIFKYNFETFILSLVRDVNFSGSDNDDVEVAWTCTHIDWINRGNSLGSLVLGYCRVTPTLDDQAEDDYDEEENDSAEHEAQLHIVDFNPVDYTVKAFVDLGDIVSFFGVPRKGRHAFFTTQISTTYNLENDISLLLVTANVGTEVELLGKDESGTWKILELAEGSKITMPTDEGDSFLYPTGLSSVLVYASDSVETVTPRILLSATDGSLSVLRLSHGGDENFFNLSSGGNRNQLPPSTVPICIPRIDPNKPITFEIPDLADETLLPDEPKSGNSGSKSLPTESETTNIEGTSGFSFSPSTFSFSTFPSESNVSSSPLEFVKSSHGCRTWSSDTQPVFGQAATLLGSTSGVAQQKIQPSAAFGFNSSASLFGSNASSTSFGGFSALAQASTGNSTFANFQSTAVTLVRPSQSNSENLESVSAAAETDSDLPLKATNTANLKAMKQLSISHMQDSPSIPAKRATLAFDGIDKERKMSIHISSIEALLDDLGEGFHGEELARQVSLMDPENTGFISRRTFISWYTNLVAEGDKANDGDLLSSDEATEREEEKIKALKQFLLLAKGGDDTSRVPAEDFPTYFINLPEIKQNEVHITVDDFPKLIESMNTTYCEEEHSRTVNRLAKGKGKIYLKDFLDWYIDWLFDVDVTSNDDESHSDKSATGSGLDTQEQPVVNTKEIATTTTGWGSIFQKKLGHWICNVCRVDNEPGNVSCAACCTPISSDLVNDKKVGGVVGGEVINKGSIGSGGFSFKGMAIESAKTGTDVGGFSFIGATSSQTQPKFDGFSFPVFNNSTQSPYRTGAKVELKYDSISQADTEKDKDAPFNAGKSELIVYDLKSDLATRAFNHFDGEKSGLLPMNMLEDLLDGVGECFSGEDQKRQIALIDPMSTGMIEKSSFVTWYVNFVSGSGIGGLDSKAHRELEREMATECFKALQKTDSDRFYVLAENFPKLFASIKGTYSEAELAKAVVEVGVEEGKIYLESFLDWYMLSVVSSQDIVQIKANNVEDRPDLVTNHSARRKLESQFAGDDNQKSESADTKRNNELISNSPIVIDTKAANSSDPNHSSAQAAARVFDCFDSDKEGLLKISRIEELLDELGEGFQGNELDTQIKLIDPDATGMIERSKFIEWYVKLLLDGDCDKSLDSADIAEREEERRKAKACFLSLAKDNGSNPYISEIDFPKLFDELNTTYCEEEHKTTVEKLAKDNGKIYLEDFLNWYIEWLFGGDECSEDSSAANPPKALVSQQANAMLGWGSIFQKKEGRWKCTVCMVENECEKASCVACEFPRPGISELKSKPNIESSALQGSNPIPGIIGPGGFSFGSLSNSNAGADSIGFSFFGGASKSVATAVPHVTEHVGSSTNTGPGTFNVNDNDNMVLRSSEIRLVSANTPAKPESKISSTLALLPVKVPTPINTQDESTIDIVRERSGFPPIITTPPAQFINRTNESKAEATLVTASPKVSTMSLTPDSTQIGSKTTATPGFPPLSATAPTPFGSLSKESKSESANSTTYPPLPVKSPTPFSAQSVPKANKEHTSSGFFTLSTTAPTPFGSQPKESKSESATSTAYPPMSINSPIPFSAQSGSKANKEHKSSDFLSATTQTTLGIQQKDAKPESSISTAYPPLPDKSPIPFSSQSESKANKHSTSSGFLRLSETAQTPFGNQAEESQPSKSSSPFGALTESKKTNIAGTGYPPLSAPAPTPFGIQPKEAKSEAAITTSYPPLPAKSPTPFSAQSGPKANKEHTSSGIFTLSSTAPTPFGSQPKESKSGSATSTAYPPMSINSPIPFSAQSGSKANKEHTSSDFLSLSATTPTTFGIQQKAAKLESSVSTAYPPLPDKSPIPFSSQSGSKANKHSTSAGFLRLTESKIKTDTAGTSSGFPPLSATAPTPFGSQPTEAKSDASISTSYPPLPDKSPTPFTAQSGSKAIREPMNSGFFALSKTAPTPFGSQANTKSPSPFSVPAGPLFENDTSGVGFPPPSAAAPALFGMQSKTSKPESSVSTAYPPMSINSPIPFSAQTGSKTNKDAAGSGFSQLHAAAPTLLESQVKESQSDAIHSTAYPVKSPTPFGAQTGSKMINDTVSSGLMTFSTKSLTAFGSQGNESKSEASSAYPPFPVTSPTPFSAQTGSTSSKDLSGSISNSALTNTSMKFPAQVQPSGSSLPLSIYPPVTNSNVKQYSKIGALGSQDLAANAPKTNTVSSVATSFVPKNVPGHEPSPSISLMSENIAAATSIRSTSVNTPQSPTKFQGSVSDSPASNTSTRRYGKLSSHELSDCSREYIKFVENLNRTRADLMRQRSTFSDDSMRKEVEQIHNVINHIMTTIARNVARIESSKTKSANIWGKKVDLSRNVAETKLLVQRLMSGDDDNFATIFVKQPLDKVSEEQRLKLAEQAFALTRLLDVANKRFYVIDNLDAPDPHLHLFHVISDTFNSVKSLYDGTDRLGMRLADLNITSIGANMQRSAPKSGRNSQQVMASPGIRKLNQEMERNKLLQKWTTIGSAFEAMKVAPVPRKRFNVYRLNDAFENTSIVIVSKPIKQSLERKTPMKFSPQLSVVVRKGWDEMSTVDQAKAKHISFAFSPELKEMTLDTATRSALSEYGTTPGTVKEAVAINSRTHVTVTPSIPQPSHSMSQKDKRSFSKKHAAEISAQSTSSPSHFLDNKDITVPSTRGPFHDKQPASVTIDSGSKPTTKLDSKLDSLDGFSNLGSSLFSDLRKQTSQNHGVSDIVAEQVVDHNNSAKVLDYVELLTKFYEQYNPSKVPEVRNHLEKYQGRETELFAKVSAKYKVENPLLLPSSPSLNQPVAPSTIAVQSHESESQTPLQEGSSFNILQPLGNTFNSALSSSQTTNQSGFGASVSTPNQLLFGGSNTIVSNAPFGSVSTGSMSSTSPFGQITASNPATSPFGSSQLAPSQVTTVPTHAQFGGRSARDLLYNFYQQHNPSKVSEVEKLLAKYQGNEEQMFRNLAKKYNKDPSVFGLSGNVGIGANGIAASPVGFGQPSALGGGPTFGSVNVNAQVVPSFTGNSFGAAISPLPGFGFGALAQAPSTPGFGSFGSANSNAFGSSTPFGAPRR